MESAMPNIVRTNQELPQSLDEIGLIERLQRAYAELEAAHTLADAAGIRAGIHAVAHWTRVRGCSADTVRRANEVKIRTDYCFGEILRQQEKNKGAAIKRGSKTEPRSDPPKLKDLGIEKKDAMYCQQLADLSPDKLEEIISQAATEGRRLTTQRAARLTRKASRSAAVEPPPLPVGTFNLIYADPPWEDDFGRGDTRDVNEQYSTMSLEQIAALREMIDQISAKDCVLFLWARSPMLPEGIEILKAWGFTYKTSAVWFKSGIGMGYYFRQDHEILLIGTRGRPGVPEHSDRQSSVVQADKSRHSEKPQVFYEIIERMYPESTRVEMFAREVRPGWTAWGAEV
jgi:N6-adenosine-specific RNA methylase IME4